MSAVIMASRRYRLCLECIATSYLRLTSLSDGSVTLAHESLFHGLEPLEQATVRRRQQISEIGTKGLNPGILRIRRETRVVNKPVLEYGSALLERLAVQSLKGIQPLTQHVSLVGTLAQDERDFIRRAIRGRVTEHHHLDRYRRIRGDMSDEISPISSRLRSDGASLRSFISGT